LKREKIIGVFFGGPSIQATQIQPNLIDFKLDFKIYFDLVSVGLLVSDEHHDIWLVVNTASIYFYYLIIKKN
jgi:hypothetical protein